MQLLLMYYFYEILINMATAFFFFRFSCVSITKESFAATLAKFDTEEVTYIFIYRFLLEYYLWINNFKNVAYAKLLS
jgi:hypothetical protein